MTTEQIDTCLKIPQRRGRAKKSIDLIKAMYSIAEAAKPITGRGVGYKLFTAGLSPSMSDNDMQRVYRLLKEAREERIIPWKWIVDESRDEEGDPTWSDPEEYTDCVISGYRRDYWNQQPVRIIVVSEKGTVRGLLRPVLDKYGVKFRVMHGFSSATAVKDIADDFDGRPLIILYVGDWDPSGLYMSERDLPERFPDTAAIMCSLNGLLSCETNWPVFHHFRRPIRRKIPDTNGSLKTTASAAGNWTRSIPMNCAPASKLKS